MNDVKSIIQENNANEFLNNSPLYKLSKGRDNIIITPHCGGYAKNVLYKTRLFVYNKLLSKLKES